MWLFTAMFGGVLFALFEESSWPLGAFLGGGLGWWFGPGGRSERVAADRELERRLAGAERQLLDVRRRLALLEAPDEAAREVQAPAAAPPAPVVQPPPVAPPLRQPAPAPARPAPARPAPRPQPPIRPPWEGIEDTALWRWLAGGNALVRAGVVILFFGVSFLLRLAYAHLHVPIEVRMLAVALGGLALFALGWRLRLRRRGFGLSLQGGGVGILYATVFASLRLFELIPGWLAFAAMASLAVASLGLAVVQESQAFAALGLGGGFLAPILASTGGGSHVLLFEYYAVLNAFVLGVSLLRSWRLIAGLGFAFTFVIGGAWGFWSYLPEQFATTEPFLVLFTAIYVAVPILFAQHADAAGEAWVDTGLVFAVPLVAFGLQVGLVRDFEYGSAWSAVALAGVYLGLARALWARSAPAFRFLAESHLALGVGFATLAIPLAWDAHWTSATWAVEGAALLWAGVRVERALARRAGLALQLAAGIAFWWGFDSKAAHVALADSHALGSAFVGLSGLFSAWLLDRWRAELPELERSVAPTALVWGSAWWALAGYFAIDAHVRAELHLQAAVWFAIGSCWTLSELERRAGFRLAWIPALALLPALVALAWLTVFGEEHVLEHFAWIAWLAGFAAHLGLLRRHESACGGAELWLHALGVWLFAALWARELAWATERVSLPATVWSLLPWALVPSALLAALAAWGPRVRWPIARQLDAYFELGAAPLALAVAAWACAVGFAGNGNPAPLGYVPLANPLDLTLAAALGAVAAWLVRGHRLGAAALRLPFAWSWAAFAGVAFVAANGALLRAVHYLAGVPFDLYELLRSDVVQTSLSIFWTLIALAAMVVATRRSLRAVWLVGAALIAVVVVKLFAVDLSNVGTLERIVSFIGVGLLLLVVGYFSPVPPRAGAPTPACTQ